MCQLSSLRTDSFQPWLSSPSAEFLFQDFFQVTKTSSFSLLLAMIWVSPKKGNLFSKQLGLGVSSSSLKEIKEFDRICYHMLPIPPNSHLSPAYGRRSKSGPCRKRPGTLRCFSARAGEDLGCTGSPQEHDWEPGESTSSQFGNLVFRDTPHCQRLRHVATPRVIAKDQIELSILAKGPTWVFQRSCDLLISDRSASA